jgi:hypothetical protein
VSSSRDEHPTWEAGDHKIVERLDALIPPAERLGVPSILRDAAKTFAERNKTYGDNYLHFGTVMSGLFPRGLPSPRTTEDWNRLGLLVQCVTKLTRYAQSLERGGHEDSAHDLSVYAAMLQSVTRP